MNIDFSYSIEDWLALFERLFVMVAEFFKNFGIDIFASEETTTEEA